MSRLGRINYRDAPRSAFLAGIPEGTARRHSEQTAREIDEEYGALSTRRLRKSVTS